MKTKFIILLTIILLALPGSSLATLSDIQNIVWEDNYNIKFDEVKNATSYKYSFSVNSSKSPTTLFTINNFENKNGIIHFFPEEALEYFKSAKTAVYRVWLLALDEQNNELTNLTQSIGGKIIIFPQLNAPTNVKFSNGIGEWDSVSNSANYEINLYESETLEPLFNFSTELTTFDFSSYLEDEKEYYFEVYATNSPSLYRNSNISKSNIFTLSLYNIFTEANNGNIKICSDNNTVSRVSKGQKLKIILEPHAGYEIDSIKIYNNEDTSSNIELSSENTFIMPSYDILIKATFLKKAIVPSISFEATGYDCGILKNDSISEIKYSIDNKKTWLSTNENSIYLENVSPTYDIIAYTPKDNVSTFIDSAFKKLTIKRASTPKDLVSVSPTSVTNKNGKIVGVTSSMQYKLSSSNSWIDCEEDNIIKNLEPGKYEIREKPYDSTLASDSFILKIEKFDEPEETNKTVNRFEIAVIQSDGGKISPETKTVREGRSCKFTITPNSGYKIKNVLIDELNYGSVTSYTFSNVHADHTIVAVFEKLDDANENNTDEKYSDSFIWENPFEDVSENAWYYNSIKFSNQNNLLSGITSTKFGPKTPMTRGMLAYVLFKHSQDSSIINPSLIFSDVKESAYYYKAISWLYENNISAGMGKNMFKPNEPVTREQLITILYNYSIYLGKDVKSVTQDFSNFDDSDAIHAWAKVPLCWALGNNLISGRTSTSLAPREATTRAEFATILMRFLNS